MGRKHEGPWSNLEPKYLWPQIVRGSRTPPPHPCVAAVSKALIDMAVVPVLCAARAACPRRHFERVAFLGVPWWGGEWPPAPWPLLPHPRLGQALRPLRLGVSTDWSLFGLRARARAPDFFGGVPLLAQLGASGLGLPWPPDVWARRAEEPWRGYERHNVLSCHVDKQLSRLPADMALSPMKLPAASGPSQVARAEAGPPTRPLGVDVEEAPRPRPLEAMRSGAPALSPASRAPPRSSRARGLRTTAVASSLPRSLPKAKAQAQGPKAKGQGGQGPRAKGQGLPRAKGKERARRGALRQCVCGSRQQVANKATTRLAEDCCRRSHCWCCHHTMWQTT